MWMSVESPSDSVPKGEERRVRPWRLFHGLSPQEMDDRDALTVNHSKENIVTARTPSDGGAQSSGQRVVSSQLLLAFLPQRGCKLLLLRRMQDHHASGSVITGLAGI